LFGLLCAFGAFSLKANEAPKADTFPSADVHALAWKVNEYQKANPLEEVGGGMRPTAGKAAEKHETNAWTRSVWYNGVMALYRATGDQRYLDQAMLWGKRNAWKTGPKTRPEKDTGNTPNHFFSAQTWVEVYLIQKDDAMIQPLVTWLKSGFPGTPGTAEVWFADHKGFLFIDSLYGAPVFPLLAKATGDNDYLKAMDGYFWAVHNLLYDSEAKLFYRDQRFIGRKSKNGQKVLWSRGNGWAYAAVARVLENLPEEAPSRPRYVQLLREMSASLAQRQGADGLWRVNLDDPAEFPVPETSGTGFFCYGLGVGVRLGYLDEATYRPVIDRAWRGLVSCVSPEGRVGYGQIEADFPFEVHEADTHEYVTGAFLLAASEISRLPQSKKPMQTIRQPQPDLQNLIVKVDHPLQSKIDRFKSDQAKVTEFTPTGLTKNDYLKYVHAQVLGFRKFQNQEGHLIDPINPAPQYASAHYAHCVSVLHASGFDTSPELLESGFLALDAATKVLEDGLPKNTTKHPDFYTFATMLAYEYFRSLAAPERVAVWKSRLEQINPAKTYVAQNSGLNNWSLVHVAGEHLRYLNGMSTRDYTDKIMKLQRHHMTEEGFYWEHGGPFSYENFGRYFIVGMLARGLDDAFYRESCWKGAWSSLFVQSPTGEVPTGFRSAQHVWGDSGLCALYETYATAYAQNGMMAEAGAFKRAAHLALATLRQWVRPDGTGYIVKNRYPIERKFGYEDYSAHLNYNILACSQLSLAWTRAEAGIAERPAPADLGGFFVQVPRFHMVFANVQGNYVQYRTNQNDSEATYSLKSRNPAGLLRVHLKGASPQLAYTDGLMEQPKQVTTFAKLANLPSQDFADGTSVQVRGRASVGDGDGGLFRYHAQDTSSVESKDVVKAATGSGHWRRVTESPGAKKVDVLAETRERVRFKVTYSNYTEIVEVLPDRVRVEVSGKPRITFPLLTFDGAEKSVIATSGNRLSVANRSGAVDVRLLEPSDAVWHRTGLMLEHRNGMVEVAEAVSKGQPFVYEILPQAGTVSQAAK
jgi:rhamnogalacturonyl hydrolase YesR